ncbi:MAG: PAS-domain containing protein, partial [Sneathiella sp.]
MVCGFLLSLENTNFAIFTYGLAFGVLVLLAYQVFSNEHKKAAQKQLLEKQYGQLSDAVEILSEGFLLYDKDQNLVTANKMTRDMIAELGLDLKPGTPRKKVEQAILSWFDSHEHKTKVGNYLKSLENIGSYFLDEIRFSTPNGRHLVLTEKFTRDQGIVSLVREETDAVNKQNELGQTSALLETVYDNIPIGICVLNADNCIISWNEKYRSVMDVSPSLIYKGITLEQHLINIFDIYVDAGDDPQSFASETLAKMTSVTSTRTERHLKSGKIVEIARTGLPGGGYVCTFNDVTLEKSTQLLLKESENRYRKMVELSPEAILVHKDGIIIYANGAAIKLLEAKNLYSIVGDNVRKFFPVADHDLLNNHFGPADHLAPGEVVSAQKSQVIGKIGKRIDVELEASAL